jgi:hypothetical protein
MKTWLCLFLLLCGCALEAQETTFNTNGDYLTLGIGIPVHTVRDRAHSALTYRGRGLRFFLQHESIKENGIYRFAFAIDNVTIRAKVKPKRDISRSAESNNIDMSFAYYHRLQNNDATDNQQYVGGAYSIQMNSRSYPLPTNNTTGVLGQSSLSIGALDRRTITDNQRWVATTRIDLPLISVIYRPSYIGVPPLLHVPHVKFKDILGAMEVVTVNKFFKLNIGIDADYQSKAWRTDRIAYDWSVLYTPLPATKPMVATFGSLGYGFRVLL